MNLRVHDWLDAVPAGAKNVLDALSITALLGSLASMLPGVATALTIIWTLIRIYETKTVRLWLRREIIEGDE